MKTCLTCPTRNICKGPCPDIEPYINQDYVSKAHGLSFTDMDTFSDETTPWSEVDSFFIDLALAVDLTKFEVSILTLRHAGLSYSEICIQLEINKPSVRNALYRARQKIKKDFLPSSRKRTILRKGGAK